MYEIHKSTDSLKAELLETIANSLARFVELELAARSINRDLAPPGTAFLDRLLPGLLVAIVSAMASEPTVDFTPEFHAEVERRESTLVPATPVLELQEQQEVAAATPKPPIVAKDDRYLELEENGKSITGKRTSLSRWTIFRLLMEAEDGRVPLAMLIRHVPAWAALLAKNDEPDDGAVKRMISKMNTLDLKPLGLPYKVRTKKDRKTGTIHVFMSAVNASPARGCERA